MFESVYRACMVHIEKNKVSMHAVCKSIVSTCIIRVHFFQLIVTCPSCIFDAYTVLHLKVLVSNYKGIGPPHVSVAIRCTKYALTCLSEAGLY